MDIDPRIAQTIVENIKGIICHDINFFDAHGKMIASTDATRIGTFHDAARLAAERKRTVAVDGDNQFIGARNGINAPVMFGDSVVAVIGITGQRHEVEPFGIMITKMTEILIRENVEQITRFDQRMMMTNLINLLVSQHNDENLVSYLSSTLDVDLSIPRCIVLGRCTNADADHASVTLCSMRWISVFLQAASRYSELRRVDSAYYSPSPIKPAQWVNLMNTIWEYCPICKKR